MRTFRGVLASMTGGLLLLAAAPTQAQVTLFQNDFNSPVGYAGCCLNGDLSAQFVNTLYGTAFQQTFTVETLRIAGGTTFSDPSGIGGAYALGMLSSAQNDLLSATFNSQGFAFINLALDISAIDLDCCGGPFNPTGTLVPSFAIRLYDAPGGVFDLNAPGVLLSSTTITGVASPRTVFDWTHHEFGLGTAGSTDGNVAVVLDLLTGGYASFDNLRITADNRPPTPAPEPGVLALLCIALAAASLRRRPRA